MITVLIPTYRRTKDLERCLEALSKQTRPPDEILVVVRADDNETWDLVKEVGPGRPELRAVTVGESGNLAAYNTGLDAAGGDIVAITDDDSAPRPDWLSRIDGHFRADPEVGGVGGRDWIHKDGKMREGSREVVGKVQWFGRAIMDFQYGVGGPREVDMLKGVNMSYRRAAIHNVRFDRRLRGWGNHPGLDYLFSLTVKRAGWKLIYDPAVAVDHYQSPRVVDGHRAPEHKLYGFDPTVIINSVHNQTLMLLEHLSPWQRIVFVLWALLVGSREAYGLVQWLRFLPSEGRLAGKKLRATLRGRLEGYRTWHRSG